jgi:anti-anti-sigma factor
VTLGLRNPRVRSPAARPSRSPTRLRIDTYHCGDETVVTLAGVLGTGDCEPIADALDWALESPEASILLDLGRLESLSRAGVHTILLACLRAEDQGQDLLIVPAPPALQQVIDLVNGPFRYSRQPDR